MSGETFEPPFEITKTELGTRVASNGLVTLTLAGEGEIFRRRAVKKHLDTGLIEHIEWAVTKVNGVYTYMNAQGHVVVSTENLYP